MRLIDLNPRWFEFKGDCAGFTFLCPCCRAVRLGVKTLPMTDDEQSEVFAEIGLHIFGAMDGTSVIPMREGAVWTISGIDLHALSVMPSVDASESGHWHGHIVKGEIK